MGITKRIRQAFSMPLLMRELSQLSARKRTYLFRVLYGSVVALVAWLGTREFITPGQEPNFDSLGKGLGLLESVAAVQYAVIYFFLPAYCAGLITAEKERDTLQLMLVSKLSPSAIIREKLLSRLIPFALMILISLPVLAVAYSLGGITVDLVWKTALLLTIASVQVASVGMFCSTFFRRTVSAFVATYVMCAALFYVWPRMTAEPTDPGELLSLARRGTPWIVQWEVFSGSVPNYVLTVSALCMVGLIGLLLLAARLCIVRRAFQRQNNPLRRVFAGVDKVLEGTTGVQLRGSDRVPDEEPIAWRETTRGVLGNTRYQLYTLGVTLTGILAFYLLNRGGNLVPAITIAEVLAFVIGALLIIAKGTSLFSGERSGQTLDVLLVSPVTNRNLMLQKYRGLRNLIAVLLLIFFVLLGLHTVEMTYRPIGLTYRVNRAFDFYRFTICHISTLIIYSQILAWLSVLIGLRFRRSLVALILTMITVLAWCIVPVVGLLLYSSMVSEPASINLFLVSCPLFVPTLNLGDTFYDRSGWALTLTNIFVYGVFWFWLRALALRQIETRLGRRDETSWVNAP